MNCVQDVNRPAPYPADTRAKGWRFELDLERIRQSDTWVLAEPEARPWLLMLWATAWEQTPCGSLPSDETLIAARIGMPAKAWLKHSRLLLRGWWLADDGRLYHPVITELVAGMVHRKDAERQRKAEYRARMDAARRPPSSDVPRDTTGTPKGQTPDGAGIDATGTGTGTGRNLIPSEANASGGRPPGEGAAQPVDLPAVPAAPPRLAPEPPTLRETAFALGVPMLTAAGVAEKSARSFLALQSRVHGDGALVAALERCAIEGAGEPISWIQRTLKPKASARHVGFEAKDYRAGVTEDGHLT